ncbi:N-acetylglucosamine-specific PTS transporter subunit IIBC [Clostridium tertium]|jgi:PTS system N-acetylglucosamine-specific IIC component|uniref:N-acetylglucosamine-specific PTS transporter subunit IIBC n=1 Tax=Clostridium tertium TaxID=1559 RepID=A0A9X3XLZ7_9CLOT|nr:MULTISPECIES: N-acetylglucosamine-specific PTS transporter subunit IIBC [Clostridium]EEH99779.1 PTS system, N-acetylglucosamine-specific IIBC component [Clostridium sp. 7_2_43FAA]MBP1869583.1 PTS system N-acetylglucosamine-specific IIC component [Clostridium tertium]MBS5308132.1 N-acetylglucosamine-specific PTS transporter subunit IIBC [Clostridium sp.]MBS6503060.1 N-acetylglucosamine-specific PTS transporter subunit IIBC [Clostridium sp.]MBU6136907.1 N-acetylglucosamine-specific PTS transp
MMKYLQRLGKSLMLPVAALPVASILMGIGYWIDPTGWGANNVMAAFLLKAGGALIDNMAILFAIGVAVGMSDDNDGTAGLAGLVSWLMITTLLSPAVVGMFKGIDVAEVPAAFSKIQTQFVGIVAGLIGATCYNKFKNTKLPDALGFFSGKRSVAIMTALASLVAALVLFFVWPVVYNALVSFGKAIVSTGAVGSGIYAFFNRLLIPTGLHHALNSVFWFDVAGINDIGNFWAGTGTQGVTGMYMTGFFPVMMFGLPAGALAMYHTAKDNKKKAVYGLLLAAALSSFFTGVTEPLEFAFMFLAPGLYVVHAALTGVSAIVCTLLPVRAGFNFSAGFVDWILSFKAPMAENPLWLIPIGLVFAILYYVVFRFVITKFNLKTPGREDDDDELSENVAVSGDMNELAKAYIQALGGKENIVSVDNCVTRLRLGVKDNAIIKDKSLTALGARGVIRPGKGNIQVIVGTNVQFVADAIKAELKR